MESKGSKAKIKVVGKNGDEIRGYTKPDTYGDGTMWIRGSKVPNPVSGEYSRVTKQIEKLTKAIKGR